MITTEMRPERVIAFARTNVPEMAAFIEAGSRIGREQVDAAYGAVSRNKRNREALNVILARTAYVAAIRVYKRELPLEAISDIIDRTMTHILGLDMGQCTKLAQDSGGHSEREMGAVSFHEAVDQEVGMEYGTVSVGLVLGKVELSKPEKIALLNYHYGLSIKEIADLFGLSESHIWRSRRMGRMALQRRLMGGSTKDFGVLAGRDLDVKIALDSLNGMSKGDIGILNPSTHPNLEKMLAGEVIAFFSKRKVQLGETELPSGYGPDKWGELYGKEIEHGRTRYLIVYNPTQTRDLYVGESPHSISTRTTVRELYMVYVALSKREVDEKIQRGLGKIIEELKTPM